MAHFGPLLRKSGWATGQAALLIPTPLVENIEILRNKTMRLINSYPIIQLNHTIHSLHTEILKWAREHLPSYGRGNNSSSELYAE